MTNFEQKTLDYLLTLQTEEEWQAWADTMDREGFDYMISLIKRAHVEAQVELMQLQEELEELEPSDVSIAQEVLAKF